MSLEKYIMAELEKFALTKAGKKLIKEKTGVNYMPTKAETDKQVAAYCQEMKNILYGYISHQIKSFEKEDIIIDDVKKDRNGQLTATLSFKEDSLFRPSLQPKKAWSGRNVGEVGGEYGVLNIVIHMAAGWQSAGSIQGTWHGREDVWSRRSYDGNSFLSDAVNEFNKIANGLATAELVGEYRSL